MNQQRIRGIIHIIPKPMGFVTELAEDAKDQESKVRDKSKDILIFGEHLNCALNNDEVEVLITGKDKYNPEKRVGKVVRILKRAKIRFVGRVEQSDNPSMAYFHADDYHLYKKVEIVGAGELRSDDKVFVELNDWNNPDINPTGTLLQKIGKAGEHETETKALLLEKDIPVGFGPDEEAEAELAADAFRQATSSEAGIQKEIAESKRLDFRQVLTFTIDPTDAKDFDDALSYRDLQNGRIEVGVHIADVSFFVREGSKLDKEARRRAFSTYLVDRTIPMLPEALSNELCSLMPSVARFAFGAIFNIEKSTGKVMSSTFSKTIIQSAKRFDYEEAQDVLDGKGYRDTALSQDLKVSLTEALQNLDRIGRIYREENSHAGAIAFEMDEVKFVLDEAGVPIKMFKKVRVDTMKLIEEWMLLANREVARYIASQNEKHGGASIYRIHDSPKIDRLEDLSIFVKALGYKLPLVDGRVKASDINALLRDIEGSSSETLIRTAAIRSMAKAIYSTRNIGHFGLAFKYYTHFTSPIRRYTDLVIHRILGNHINSGPISRDEIERFETISRDCSARELTVVEAERENIKYKQVEYMQGKVGQHFAMMISGVAEFGMFVEDPETKIEGLVRMKDLGDDFYSLDEKNYRIIGERSKQKFTIGDKVRVKLLEADIERKSLNFALV